MVRKALLVLCDFKMESSLSHGPLGGIQRTNPAQKHRLCTDTGDLDYLGEGGEGENLLRPPTWEDAENECDLV